MALRALAAADRNMRHAVDREAGLARLVEAAVRGDWRRDRGQPAAQWATMHSALREISERQVEVEMGRQNDAVERWVSN